MLDLSALDPEPKKPFNLDDYKASMAAAFAWYCDNQKQSRYPAKKPKPIDGEGVPRKKKSDYNDRTKAYLTRCGYEWRRVDHFDYRTMRSHDLFGIFDYVAFKDGATIGVQVTSTGQMSTRKKKIIATRDFEIVKSCGWKVLVLGFEPGKPPKELWL